MRTTVTFEWLGLDVEAELWVEERTHDHPGSIDVQDVTISFQGNDLPEEAQAALYGAFHREIDRTAIEAHKGA